MKNPELLRRMFVVFHIVLGLALLFGSIMTAVSNLHGSPHIRLLGGIEAFGALLFLVPRTLRIGAGLLLVTIGVALAIHAAMGEWRIDLLVYAAGVAFVAAHGAAYTRVPGPARVASFLLLILLPVASPAGSPPPPKTGYIAVGKYSLYYEETGKGEPLILIHGGLLDRRMWDAQFELFGRWARVIRYDNRNHGLSHGLPDSFAYHEDLNRVMEALGIQRARIVGLSLGGSIAVDFALTHPEKVSALVLVSSELSGYEFRDSTLKTNQKRQSEAAARKDMNAYVEYYQRSWTDGPNRTAEQVNRDVRVKVRDMCRATLSKPEADNTTIPLDPPALGRLAAVHVPTLVVLGDLDMPGVQEIAGLVLKGIPGSRKVVIKGAGHMVNMEKPEEFNELVGEFLSR